MLVLVTCDNPRLVLPVCDSHLRYAVIHAQKLEAPRLVLLSGQDNATERKLSELMRRYSAGAISVLLVDRGALARMPLPEGSFDGTLDVDPSQCERWVARLLSRGSLPRAAKTRPLAFLVDGRNRVIE